MHRPAPRFATCALLLAVLVTRPALGIENDWRFRHITARDGLSQGVVNDLLQDATGFVWLATQDGLNRYDGRRMRVFQNIPGDPASIGGNCVWCLAEDRAGRIWYGTEGAGFGFFNPVSESFTNFRWDPRAPATLDAYEVQDIAVGEDDRVWLATSQHGLLRFDPTDSTLTSWRHDADDPQSLAADEVWCVLPEASGSVWVGTPAGLSRVDPSRGDVRTWRHDPSDPGTLAGDDVRSLHRDREGRLWVGTVGALHLYDPAADGFRRYVHVEGDPHSPGPSALGGIVDDASGRLWIASLGDGLAQFDPATGRFRSLRHDPLVPTSLVTDRLNDLMLDRSGLLWVATQNGASLVDLQAKRFQHVRPGRATDGRLSDPTVWSVCEDRHGDVWVATEGGLNRIRTGNDTVRVYRHDRNDSTTVCADALAAVYEDSHGRLWVGSDRGGLGWYHPRSDAFVNYAAGPEAASGLRNDRIFGIAEDQRGTLWFATLGGLHRYDRAKDSFEWIPTDSAGADAGLRAVFADSQGRLWLGTWSERIQRYDPRSGNVVTYRHDPADPHSPTSNVAICFTEDSRGDIWIGTTNGLNRYDPQTDDFERFGVADGLPNATVYGVLEDARGNLWISTNQGLSRFSPATGNFDNYDVSDGLQDNEFNSQSCRLGPSGRMYFGGINGLTVFRPGEIRNSRSRPRVVITDLLLANRSLRTGEIRDGRLLLPRPAHLTETLELGHGDAVLTIEFTALDFAAPNAIRYAYRLDGFDPGWHEVGDRHHATYTNLPPGRYTFRVRATNHDGVWSPYEAGLTVTIAPPFWQTGWFRATALVLILGSLGGAHLSRTRLIRRRNRELQRHVAARTADLEQEVIDRRRAEAELVAAKEQAIAATRAKSDFLANMSHEIRTPLNGVIGLTTALLDTELSAQQREYCEMAQSSANALLNVISDVLDFSKIEAGKLELESVATAPRDVVDEVCDMLAWQAWEKGLSFTALVEPDVPPVVLADPSRLRQILLNLAGNAVKFTSAGHVDLRVAAVAAPDGPRLRWEVRDTGGGIPPAERDRLFDSFSQLDTSTTRRFGGTGLGLAISRQLVGLMHGQIGCESEVGAGSLFWFQTPLETPATLPPSPLRKARILVVAAETQEAAALAAQLAFAGYAPDTAADAEEAVAFLAAAAASGEPVAACLVAATQGIAGAAAFAAALRAQPPLAATPLVLVSRPAVYRAHEACADLGFAACLTTPVRHRKLAEVLAAVCGGPTAPVPPAAPPARAPATPDGTRPRLLLAEDNPINQRVAGLILDKLGYDHDVVASGDQVLRALGRRRYAAVLMDVQMPGMDGLEAARRVRDHASPVLDHDVPIIAMTAHALRSDRERCLAAGMNDHVTKPVESAVLADALLRVLGKTV